MADNTFDIKLDGDSDIVIGSDNDISTVDGAANVRQTIAIIARNVVRPLVGEQITGTTLERVRSQLIDDLESSPKITSVTNLTFEEINQQTNVVTLEIVVDFNENYTVEVNV